MAAVKQDIDSTAKRPVTHTLARRLPTERQTRVLLLRSLVEQGLYVVDLEALAARLVEARVLRPTVSSPARLYASANPLM